MDDLLKLVSLVLLLADGLRVPEDGHGLLLLAVAGGGFGRRLGAAGPRDRRLCGAGSGARTWGWTSGSGLLRGEDVPLAPDGD